MKNKFIIRYNDKEVYLEHIEEIIAKLNRVIQTCSQEKIFILIEMWNKRITMALLNNEECVILINPKNKNEDSKITYKNLLDKERKYTKLNSKEKYSFSFSQYNVICVDEGLIEIRNILEDSSLILNWHSY